MKNIDGFDAEYLNIEHINNIVLSLFPKFLDSVYNSMEEHFPEAYPAHIFKNVGRLKELA